MTAERNTIFDLVSDVEDEITNLEGYAILLQLAADGVASHHGQEAGDGLICLATETNACVRRLREWHSEAHAAVVGQRQQAAAPAPVTETNYSEPPADMGKPRLAERRSGRNCMPAGSSIKPMLPAGTRGTTPTLAMKKASSWRTRKLPSCAR